MSLRDTHSTGPDGLATKTLKLASNFIITPLTYIINLSFSQGIFPNSIKNAKVIPFHKKCSTDNIENYRPIKVLLTTKVKFLILLIIISQLWAPH